MTLFLKLIFIMLVLSAIYYVYYQNIEFYYTIIDIFCLSVSGAMAVVTFFKDDLTGKSVFGYIGIGVFYIFLITFIKIIIVKELGYDINGEFVTSIKFFNIIIEYLTIIIAVIMKRNKPNKTIAALWYTIIYIIILSIFRYFIISFQLRIVTICILFVAIIYTLYSNKNIIGDEEQKSLFIVIIILSCYHIFFIMSKFFGIEFVILVGLFKCMAYYLLYIVFEEFIFKKQYRAAKVSLEYSKLIQENRNRILKDRNRNLRELKTLIEKSEKRYSELITSIRDGIVIINYNRITYINEVVVELFQGFREEEIKGKTIQIVIKKAYFKNIISRTFYENLNDFDFENAEKNKLYKITSIKKQTKEYDVYFVKMDGKGQLIYIKDVTEVNRNHKLRNEYEEYLKEEESKNQFYTNISHELRTPINLIYSALQLNQIHLKNNKLKGIEKNNSAIKQNCLRLIRTINNFIDANRITEGYLKPNLNIYNIVPIIENTSIACAYYIEKIKNNLIFDSVEEEIYVKCDRDMIERIMLNLLSNSVKYGRPNGNIFVNIYLEDEKVMIFVRSDNYIIDKEMQTYLFDKFTKLNKSLHRDREGSGLGLFLVKELLTLNNATIKVESNSEIGTQFIMEFDRQEGSVDSIGDEGYGINSLKDKVDTEFSDIYI